MREDTVEAIALGLPDDWQELPLEPEAFERSLREQLDGLRAADMPMLERRRLELLQRQLRELLLAQDVRYVATLMMVVAGEGDADEPVLLNAAATVSVIEREALDAPARLTASLLLRGLSDTREEDGPLDLDAPSLMDLPAGQAVRLARLHRTPIGAEAPIESVVQTYLVPFDEGERLCSLQLLTLNPEHGGAFSQVFDAVAKTLRLFRPGDPTTFDAPAPAGGGAPADGDVDPEGAP